MGTFHAAIQLDFTPVKIHII